MSRKEFLALLLEIEMGYMREADRAWVAGDHSAYADLVRHRRQLKVLARLSRDGDVTESGGPT